MANDSQTATTLLRYQVDNSSVQTAVLANTKVLESIQAVGTGTQTVAEQMLAAGASAQEIFDLTGESIATGVTVPIDAADASVKTLIRDIGDLGHDIEAIPEPDLSAFGVDESGGGGGGLGGGGLGGLTTSRRGISALGSLAGGNIGGGLGDVSRLVSVGAAFGTVGVAAGVAAIAIKAVTDAIAEETAVETKRLDVERQVAHEVSSLTSKQVQEKIDAAQASLDIDKAVSNKQTANAALYTLSIVDQPLALGRALAGLDPTYNAYQDAIAKNKVAIEGDQASIDALTVSMGKGATAAADQAAANKQLADLLVANSNQILEVDKLTTAQRNTRAEQDRRDIALINDQIQAGGLTAEATYDLSVQQEKLYNDYQAVTGVSTTYAQQLLDEAAAKDALTKQDQTYLDTLASEGKIRDAITATEADILKVRQDAADKATDLQKDFFAKDDASTEAANEKSLQIEADNADKRQKIQRDSGRDESNAIANRDAVALTKAKQKEADQLDDAKDADKKAQDQLTKSLDKDYHAHYDAYQKSLAQLNTATNKELATKDRALQQQQVDLINVTNAELSIRANSGGQILAGVASMQSQVEQLYFTHATNLVNGLHAILGGAGQAAYLSSFNSPTPLPPASNGYGTQGALTPAKVISLIDNRIAEHIGMRQGA